MTQGQKNPLAKSAAETAKREFRVLCLSEADVIHLLDPRTLLDGLAEGFRALSSGKVQVPARPAITVPGKGFSLAMPAWTDGTNIMVKVSTSSRETSRSACPTISLSSRSSTRPPARRSA